MNKKRLMNNTARLALAVSLVFGASLVTKAETTHADDMGCYGWFDFVYKSTGDLNFANYHFMVCRGEAVAPKLHKAGELIPVNPIIPGPGVSLEPLNPASSLVPIAPIGASISPIRGGFTPRIAP